MNIEVKDGSGAGLSWVITFDEDVWNSYDSEGQEYCKDTWRRKAAERGKTIVALRLIPDFLFPSGDHTLPYIAWKEEIKPLTQTVRKPTFAQAREHWKNLRSIRGYEEIAGNDSIVTSLDLFFNV